MGSKLRKEVRVPHNDQSVAGAIMTLLDEACRYEHAEPRVPCCTKEFFRGAYGLVRSAPRIDRGDVPRLPASTEQDGDGLVRRAVGGAHKHQRTRVAPKQRRELSARDFAGDIRDPGPRARFKNRLLEPLRTPLLEAEAREVGDGGLREPGKPESRRDQGRDLW